MTDKWISMSDNVNKKKKKKLLKFYQVNKKTPAKLLMIGDGPERLKTEQLCRSLKINKHIYGYGKLLELY